MAEQTVNALSIETPNRKLLERLRRFRIPIEAWGIGGAKSLQQLVHELQTGESFLEESAEGKLLRVLHGVEINIYYRDAGVVYKLVEERPSEFDASVTTRLRPGERPEGAARRALVEDLNISDGELGLTPRKDTQERFFPSKAFPGLQTKYVSHGFSLSLPSEYYRSEGYVKKQGTRSTRFVWARM